MSKREHGIIPLGGVLTSPVILSRKTGIPISLGGTLHAPDETDEADSGSSMVGFLRPTNKDEASGFPKGPKITKHAPDRKAKKVPKLKVPKDHAPTSESSSVRIRTGLREAAGSSVGGGKYRVILIQEGLGNLRDCFYYTKDCLKNSVDEFEGIKCFADHPNQIEEQIHPERSTRDILGHYEDVEYVETDGCGALEGTLVLCEGEHFDWAKSLLTNALEYATKYKDADFVGFSINAQGEAGSADMGEFIQSGQAPESALAKLQKAAADGIDEIRPVTALRDAVSVDLVTEAGAGGKILTMMERNQSPMKKTPPKKNNTKESKKTVREADDDQPAGGMPPGQKDHADADQDVALFKKMVGQYLGPDHADNEEAMGMAKASHEHFMKQGMEGEEAYEAAGNHLKNSSAIGAAMKAGQAEESEETEESEEHEETESHEESEEHEEAGGTPLPPASKGKKGAAPMPKESNKSEITLKAEVAALRESVNGMKVEKYLEKKLAGSERSPEFITAFREALGKPKSVEHVDQMWTMFEKAAEAAQAEVGTSEESMFTESDPGRMREASGSDNVIDFSTCVRR